MSLTITMRKTAIDLAKWKMGSQNMHETLGRRIDSCLWEMGMRDGLGDAYEQNDLIAWLSGQTVAPNGKKYKIKSANQSTVNRTIRDNMKRPPLDMLAAIAEISGRSLDWLITGEENFANGNDKHDIYMTPEAGEVGAIVDTMDRDSRLSILQLCREWKNNRTLAITQGELLSDTQKRLAYVIDSAREFMPTQDFLKLKNLVDRPERFTNRPHD